MCVCINGDVLEGRACVSHPMGYGLSYSGNVGWIDREAVILQRDSKQIVLSTKDGRLNKSWNAAVS